MAFTEEQLERYSRHIILKGVGLSGQKKLLAGRVLVIGAGGLGAPALLYLAASGVGTIGIADGDRVELSNLQRQVIHDTPRVGQWKAESAAEMIGKINPDVKTVLYKERVTAENIAEIIRDYDFIVDGVDNFASKFLINDACVLEKKPFCHAGVRGFYGQAMTYVPGEGPCYRCVFEEIPPEGDMDSCSQAGVLGTMPGILGSIQALEAQKYLLGTGDLLTGKILTFDGLSMKPRTVPVPEASAGCRVCGSKADIRRLRPEEYEERTSCEWKR
ncbi:MAG: HesA/MoeB/ThiF family protein [Lachnospiraceae bacterium]|nr:HesA/MoeB/ThiF family protein [Lachnospiraceae bacterium]